MTPSFPSPFICPDCGNELIIKTNVKKKSLACNECNKKFSFAEAKLKTFSFWYPERCPIARDIENTVNYTGSSDSKLDKCRSILSTYSNFIQFIFTCLLYWSRMEHWDDRNSFAVLASKRIVEKFPNIGFSVADNEDLQREAFGFTNCAHRYLQNEFFGLIMKFLKSEELYGITDWFEQQEFVYANDKKSLIPRAEWNQYSI